jgi:hypothetical protein
MPPAFLTRLWAAALASGGIGYLVLRLLPQGIGPVWRAALVLAPFGLMYLVGTALLGVPLARQWMDRLLKRA